MRQAAALLLLAVLAGPPARAFEWDDVRGAFPFRPVTTRNYEAARDLDHMAPDRRAATGAASAKASRRQARSNVGALYAVSTTRPANPLILRSVFPGQRGGAGRFP